MPSLVIIVKPWLDDRWTGFSGRSYPRFTHTEAAVPDCLSKQLKDWHPPIGSACSLHPDTLRVPTRSLSFHLVVYRVWLLSCHCLDYIILAQPSLATPTRLMKNLAVLSSLHFSFLINWIISFCAAETLFGNFWGWHFSYHYHFFSFYIRLSSMKWWSESRRNQTINGGFKLPLPEREKHLWNCGIFH